MPHLIAFAREVDDEFQVGPFAGLRLVGGAHLRGDARRIHRGQLRALQSGQGVHGHHRVGVGHVHPDAAQNARDSGDGDLDGLARRTGGGPHVHPVLGTVFRAAARGTVRNAAALSALAPSTAPGLGDERHRPRAAARENLQRLAGREADQALAAQVVEDLLGRGPVGLRPGRGAHGDEAIGP